MVTCSHAHTKGLTSYVKVCTVVQPGQGSRCGRPTGASVDHTRHLRLARGAHQARVDIGGVGQQLGLPGEGVGGGHGMNELWRAVLTDLGR